MTPPAFLSALESHLQRSSVPFARGDLIAFVEACGPVEDVPDLDCWAIEFCNSQLRGIVRVGAGG